MATVAQNKEKEGWAKVAQRMGREFTAHQCKSRWRRHNAVQPRSIVQGEWSEHEEYFANKWCTQFHLTVCIVTTQVLQLEELVSQHVVKSLTGVSRARAAWIGPHTVETTPHRVFRHVAKGARAG